MKNHVTKFNLEEAFKALDELTYASSDKGLAARTENLAEGYRRSNGKLATETLLEDYYNLEDDNDVEDAVQARADDIAKAKLTRIEKIIDLDAKSPDDLLPSYVGKIIVQCPQCMNLFYKDKEDVEVDANDPTTCNVDEPCQHCGNVSGYTIIGKVGAADEPEQESSSSEEQAESDENSEEPTEEESELQNPEDQEESTEQESESEETSEEETGSDEDESDEVEDLDLNLESLGLIDGTPLREDVSDNSEAEPSEVSDEADLQESVASDLAAFEASLSAPDYQISEDLEDSSSIQEKCGTTRQPSNAEFKQMLTSKVWQDFAEDAKFANLHEGVASDLAAFEASLDEDFDSEKTLKKQESNLDEAIAITSGVDEINDAAMTSNSRDNIISSKPEVVKVYMHPEIVDSDDDEDNDEDDVTDLTDLGDSPIQESKAPLTEGVLDLLKRKAGDVAGALKRVSLKFGAQKTLDNALKSYSVHTGSGADTIRTSLSDALAYAEQISKTIANKNKPILISGTTDKGKKLNNIVVYKNGKVMVDNIQTMIQSLKAEAATGDSGSNQNDNNTEDASSTKSSISSKDVEKVQPEVEETIANIKEKLSAILDVDNLASIQYKENPELNDSFIDLKRAVLKPKATSSGDTAKEVERLTNLYNQFKTNYINYTRATQQSKNDNTSTEKNRSKGKNKQSSNSVTSTEAEQLRKSLKNKIDAHKTDLDWLTKSKAALSQINAASKDKTPDGMENQSLKSGLTPADVQAMRHDLDEALAKCAWHSLSSVRECEDSSINSCIGQTLKEVYSNISAFQMTNCTIIENKFVIEGLITFNSGKTRHTEYQFNNAMYESKKLVLTGLNEAFGRDSHFSLSCRLDNNVLIAEQLVYNYKINNTIVEGLVNYND